MAELDKEFFKEVVVSLMEQFDNVNRKLDILVSKQPQTLDGEVIYDNQDLCQLLNISKRTLQRYRSAEGLLYHRLHNKIFYYSRDVDNFIKEHFGDIKKERLKCDTSKVR